MDPTASGLDERALTVAFANMVTVAFKPANERQVHSHLAPLRKWLQETGALNTGSSRDRGEPKVYLDRSDPERVKVVLGLAPPSEAYPDPGPEVRAQARDLLSGNYSQRNGVEHQYGGGFRPSTPDELLYWTQLHSYPPFPAAASAPTEPQPSFEPSIHVVQPNETLWDLAELSPNPMLVTDLVAWHNQHNPIAEPDFDPGLIDGKPTSGKPTGSDASRRDPDLIRPGDRIYLPRGFVPGQRPG